MNANHHHHWRLHSSHVTSEGFVRYEGCPCGAWRIALRSTETDRTVVREYQERQTGAISRR